MGSNSLNDRMKRKISIFESEFDIYGDPDDHYFNTLPQKFSEHESILTLVKKSGCNPYVIIDVGASYGLFTLGASVVFPSAKIYCYEPHPNTYDSLILNTKSISERVFLNNYAIGDVAKSMLFHLGGPINSKRSSGSHLINNSHWKENYLGINVLVSTLDIQVKTHSITDVGFIKIDVEGFELDVLQGALALIEQCSPLIYLEFNSWALMALKNINPRSFLDYLSDSFKYVYCCNNDGTLTQIVTGEDRMAFLHQNLILHGCVDNLLLSNADFWLK